MLKGNRKERVSFSCTWTSELGCVAELFRSLGDSALDTHLHGVPIPLRGAVGLQRSLSRFCASWAGRSDALRGGGGGRLPKNNKTTVKRK